MKKTTIILVLLSLIALQQSFANPIFLVKDVICYEETITLGDLVNTNNAYDMTMQIKLDNNTYQTILSYIWPATPPGTIINLLNYNNLVSMPAYSSKDIIIKLSGSAGGPNSNYSIEHTYTIYRGSDGTFGLPLPATGISILNGDGHPRTTAINMVDIEPSASRGGEFTSATASIVSNTDWKFDDLTSSKNLWGDTHTITFYPAKLNGCGIESIVKSTKLMVPFEFESNIKLCRTAEKVDLWKYVKKPLPATYSQVKYEGLFTCDEVPGAISGNIFDPTLIPVSNTVITIKYTYIQRSLANIEHNSITGSFNISFLEAPETPIFAANDTTYCFGETAYVFLTNYVSKTYHWFTENDTITSLLHPFSIKNIQPGYTLYAAYKAPNGCYSKTKAIIKLDTVHAEFTLSAATATTDQTIQFNAGFDNAKTYTWNFGDGTSEFKQDAGHIFNNEGTYDISLSVESNNGCTAKQTKKSAIVVNNGTGTNLKNVENISIWPQPVSSELNFSIPSIVNASCTITDLSGKNVFSKSLTEETNRIDVSMLNQGMFILTIKTTDAVYVKQFIKE